jgi:hypothetical protein
MIGRAAEAKSAPRTHARVCQASAARHRSSGHTHELSCLKPLGNYALSSFSIPRPARKDPNYTCGQRPGRAARQFRAEFRAEFRAVGKSDGTWPPGAGFHLEFKRTSEILVPGSGTRVSAIADPNYPCVQALPYFTRYKGDKCSASHVLRAGIWNYSRDYRRLFIFPVFSLSRFRCGVLSSYSFDFSRSVDAATHIDWIRTIPLNFSIMSYSVPLNCLPWETLVSPVPSQLLCSSRFRSRQATVQKLVDPRFLNNNNLYAMMAAHLFAILPSCRHIGP